MGEVRIKNTAQNREVYHDGSNPPVRLAFAPGEERTVTLSDAGAKELAGRADRIGRNYRGLVILGGKMKTTAPVALQTVEEEEELDPVAARKAAKDKAKQRNPEK